MYIELVFQPPISLFKLSHAVCLVEREGLYGHSHYKLYNVYTGMSDQIRRLCASRVVSIGHTYGYTQTLRQQAREPTALAAGHLSLESPKYLRIHLRDM